MIVLRLYVLFHLTSIFCALYRLSNLRNRRLYLLWSFWQNYVALLEADFYPLAKFRLNSRNTACPTCDFRKSLFHLISWFLSSRLFIEVIAFIILCTKMGFWPLILLKREATYKITLLYAKVIQQLLLKLLQFDTQIAYIVVDEIINIYIHTLACDKHEAARGWTSAFGKV